VGSTGVLHSTAVPLAMLFPGRDVRCRISRHVSRQNNGDTCTFVWWDLDSSYPPSQLAQLASFPDVRVAFLRRWFHFVDVTRVWGRLRRGNFQILSGYGVNAKTVYLANCNLQVAAFLLLFFYFYFCNISVSCNHCT
jgi:hypothetical protein